MQCPWLPSLAVNVISSLAVGVIFLLSACQPAIERAPETTSTSAATRSASVPTPYVSSDTSSTDKLPAFSGARAFQHAKFQVELGPRPAGSAASQRVRQYAIKKLQALGFTVQVQSFTAHTPLGDKAMANIVAHRPGTLPGALLVAAHYDTKYFPDQEFVGANDGASGVAVLLELARTLAPTQPTPATYQTPTTERTTTAKQTAPTQQTAPPTSQANATSPVPSATLRHGITFVLLDGEEAWQNWGPEDSLYGSRYYTSTLPEPPTTPTATASTIPATATTTATGPHSNYPLAAIIIDMVGTPDLQLTYDGNSTPELMELVFSTGSSLGYTRHFSNRDIDYIDDDHIPFLQHGIPAVDVIGFRSTPLGPYPPTWHTPQDTLSQVSPDSLQAVGHTLQTVLTHLDQQLP